MTMIGGGRHASVAALRYAAMPRCRHAVMPPCLATKETKNKGGGLSRAAQVGGAAQSSAGQQATLMTFLVTIDWQEHCKAAATKKRRRVFGRAPLWRGSRTPVGRPVELLCRAAPGRPNSNTSVSIRPMSRLWFHGASGLRARVLLPRSPRLLPRPPRLLPLQGRATVGV